MGILTRFGGLLKVQASVIAWIATIVIGFFAIGAPLMVAGTPVWALVVFLLPALVWAAQKLFCDPYHGLLRWIEVAQGGNGDSNQKSKGEVEDWVWNG